MLRLSMTRWIVSASGYWSANWQTTCANSNPERSGVAKVKWRPALGSTAQKTLARATTLVFAIVSCLPPWLGWRRWADVGVKGNWLLIQAHHGRLGVNTAVHTSPARLPSW